MRRGPGGAAGWGLALALAALPAGEVAAQAPRVHPEAREIRGYQLTLEHLGRFEQVARALDGHRVAGRTRPDVALFLGLQAAWIGDAAWHDATVDEAARLIDAGDPALRTAVHGAGLASRDYVLTQMTLLLAHHVVVRAGHGLPTPPSPDLSPETNAFLARHGAAIHRVMTAFIRRVDAEAKRLAPR